MKGQKSLNYHNDGSEFSFIIALNEDFTGGGTHFKEKNKLIKLGIGDCYFLSVLINIKAEIIRCKIYINWICSFKRKNFCDNLLKKHY